MASLKLAGPAVNRKKKLPSWTRRDDIKDIKKYSTQSKERKKR